MPTQPSRGKATHFAAPNTVRPPRRALLGATRLLPMFYTPAELADELGLTAPTVRDWLRRGLPHQRDDRGRLWIDGRACATWIDQARRTTQPRHLGAGEAFCLKGRQPVQIDQPTWRFNGKATLLTGRCPRCATAVFRGARRD